MKTKRWLVIVPVALLLLFLQSPFWVPNYESQAELGEGRLGTFIESGIGDPTKINPIISSDAAAGQIEGAIFEGLINVDEDQSFVGDLALRWETTEVAFLAILPGRKLPDGVVASADVVAERLRAAVAAGRVRVDGESVVTDIAVLPAEERETSVTLVEEDDQGRPTPREVQVRVEVPPRVELTLDRVVPDLFDLLEPILGSEVLDEDGVAALVEPADPADREAIAPKLPELLAVREHNPVLTFFLRPDVTFHDGHVSAGSCRSISSGRRASKPRWIVAGSPARPARASRCGTRTSAIIRSGPAPTASLSGGRTSTSSCAATTATGTRRRESRRSTSGPSPRRSPRSSSSRRVRSTTTKSTRTR
jgi:hypothetical protein